MPPSPKTPKSNFSASLLFSHPHITDTLPRSRPCSFRNRSLAQRAPCLVPPNRNTRFTQLLRISTVLSPLFVPFTLFALRNLFSTTQTLHALFTNLSRSFTTLFNIVVGFRLKPYLVFISFPLHATAVILSLNFISLMICWSSHS